MNEEIDETEFYHQDFTTASEWEIFIARIEEIINLWRNEGISSEICDSWLVKKENLLFVDFNFTLSLHIKNVKSIEEESDDILRKNLFNTNYDFDLLDSHESSTDHFCIHRWYGINKFIVLSPQGNVGVNSESKIKVLLSSLYVAAGNLQCEIPLFVQIKEKWQNCYLGVYELEQLRTNLEMVHLKTGPRLCQYLCGLIELFKSKISAPTLMTTIIVSLQSTYVLNEFGSYIWKQDYTSLDDENFSIRSLPFGVTVDPIDAITLKTTWSHVNHRSVRDSESYSDFDPLLAPKWSLLATTSDMGITLLSECFNESFSLLNNMSTVYEILGEFVSPVSSDNNNPLDLLTEPKVPTISSLLTRAARNSLTKSYRKGSPPLTEDILVPILYFLFPDADLESEDIYSKNDKNIVEQVDLDLENECKGFKTCDPDSLIWRLCIVLTNSLQLLGGTRAYAHLWFEFVQEMRYRWENCITIPGIAAGNPDLRTNLFHQKLQMLNCCIKRKEIREKGLDQKSRETEDSSTEEDEFFDCADQEEESRKRPKYSLWNQPVGRLKQLEDLKLLKTGDSLYIPVTQEAVPKTEDQLEEDTVVLLKLGSDAQASELRAKMMSASLLSDMESFKAANPGSILEDFIRWYSPRDWIETDEITEFGQKKGQLSSRMLIEDNFWVQTWESAQPVPAHRQKRLFDDTREAEKVLHYLDSLNMSQITEMLIPVLCQIAIYRLAEQCRQITSESLNFTDRLRSLIKAGERISRENKLPTQRCENFFQEMATLEMQISQINSLMYKLNHAGTTDVNLSNLISNLVKGCEVEIADGANSSLGKKITDMFSDAQKVANMIMTEQRREDGKSINGNMTFPQPYEREIVLRVSVPKPVSQSMECPQFLRAILGKNEFRLIGAFSEDIVFF